MTDYANYWHPKGKNGKKKEIKSDFHSLISGSALKKIDRICQIHDIYDRFSIFLDTIILCFRPLIYTIIP